jgi:hypothetical protein
MCRTGGKHDSSKKNQGVGGFGIGHAHHRDDRVYHYVADGGDKGFLMRKQADNLLKPDELTLIAGILTEPGLDRDEMAEVLTTVRDVTIEAANILVRDWFDLGRYKMEWDPVDLKKWIQSVLISKLGREWIMTNFGVELTKKAAIADKIATSLMTEEQYLESKGVGMSALGEFGAHRYPRRPSKSQERSVQKLLLQQQNEWQDMRDRLREEYRQKVQKGEIRPPSRVERLLQTARGMPENPSVQAARRILRGMGLWNDEMERESNMNKTAASGDVVYEIWTAKNLIWTVMAKPGAAFGDIKSKALHEAYLLGESSEKGPYIKHGDIFWRPHGSYAPKVLYDGGVKTRAAGLLDESSLFNKIRPGSRVTIVTPHGSKLTGRAVMKGPAGWVLNLGGLHGTPGIASEDNVIAVQGGRTSEDTRESKIASSVVANEVTNTMIEQIRSTYTKQIRALLKTFGVPFAMYGVKKLDDDTVTIRFKSTGTLDESMAGYKLKYDYGSDTYVFTPFYVDQTGATKWGRDHDEFYVEDLTDVFKMAYIFEEVKPAEKAVSKKDFTVYGLGNSRGGVKFHDAESLVQAMKSRGINQYGVSDSPRLRPELQGLPKFDKLLGPMWDGSRGVRYETSEVNDMLST